MNMMSGGISVNQRSLILIPFPYSDLSSSKKRPALVVSSDKFNRTREDIVCCLITNNPKDRQHAVQITNHDMESGFLEFESKVKPYRLFTVSKKVVYKILGTLKKDRFNEVVSEIYELIPKA